MYEELRCTVSSAAEHHVYTVAVGGSNPSLSAIFCTLSIMYKFLIKEAKTAPLYHYTPFANFVNILKTDTLKGYTHPNQVINNDHNRYVYVTRDYGRQLSSDRSRESIGFRLDQEKLSNNYKIIPSQTSISSNPKIKYSKTSIVGDKVYVEKPYGYRWEAEEKIIGDIKNIKDYITGVVISDSHDINANLSMDEFSHVTVVDFVKRVMKDSGLNVPIIYKRKELKL